MKQHLEPVEIIRFDNGKLISVSDLVSVEEPLGIRLKFHDGNSHISKDISITMRTPGNDIELAIGFLFTEGIIRDYKDVSNISQIESSENTWVEIVLGQGLTLNIDKLERHFYTTSSCGVCGKSSIEAVNQACTVIVPQKKWSVSHQILQHLPEKLRKLQSNFEFSGGNHACGLFGLNGELVTLREDVGRHNALDKLIGWAMKNDELPLFKSILLLSGRASFELIQKAAMAGIRLVCAIGAPSSLAVELAEEFDITLVGFLKENRFNVYTGANRISF